TSLREGLLAVGKQGQEDRGRALSRNALPDLVRRETEDRRDGTTENLYNVIHRGLGGASRQTVGAGGVLPILDHVQIEAAQLDHPGVVYFLVNPQEMIVLVVLGDLRMQQLRLTGAAVGQRLHATGRQRTRRR